MNVEVRGIDIAYERNGRGQPLGFLHGHGTGTQDSGTVRGLLKEIVGRDRNEGSAGTGDWAGRPARHGVVSWVVAEVIPER